MVLISQKIKNNRKHTSFDLPLKYNKIPVYALYFSADSYSGANINRLNDQTAYKICSSDAYLLNLLTHQRRKIKIL